MNKIEERDIPLKREDWLMVNENFKEIHDKTGIELEMLNCGEAPNDGTGDLVRDACMKMNRNFKKIELFMEQKIK